MGHPIYLSVIKERTSYKSGYTCKYVIMVWYHNKPW